MRLYNNVGFTREQVARPESPPLSRVVSALVLTAQAHMVKLRQMAPLPPANFQSKAHSQRGLPNLSVRADLCLF